MFFINLTGVKAQKMLIAHVLLLSLLWELKNNIMRHKSKLYYYNLYSYILITNF